MLQRSVPSTVSPSRRTVHCHGTASTRSLRILRKRRSERSLDTLVNVRRMMRNSGRGRRRRVRGRRMYETAWPKGVDEPVDRIPVHGTGVDRARRYHSGQRYPPRLYLVRGGRGNGRARMSRNGAAAAMHGASSMLRHNWNSMTPRTGEGRGTGTEAL